MVVPRKCALLTVSADVPSKPVTAHSPDFPDPSDAGEDGFSGDLNMVASVACTAAHSRVTKANNQFIFPAGKISKA